MPRQGREFEQIAEGFQRFFGSTNVDVRSPDYIEGRLSHQQREIDVSLRGEIGGGPFFAIVECRDRNGKGDLAWLEQVAQKREDVGADMETNNLLRDILGDKKDF